jgi:hypothetical protein
MLDGVFGPCHALVAFPPGKRSGTNYTGGWVVPRADIDGCGKSCLLQFSTLRQWKTVYVLLNNTVHSQKD